MGIQCPSTQDFRKPSMRSPQYSDLADEQEMLLFGGGLNASDSGFGGSSNVLLPDDAGILQVMSVICMTLMFIIISMSNYDFSKNQKDRT